MNNLMQRRKQQMQQAQQMVGQQGDSDFNSWYNMGSAIGGAAFGGMAGRSDGQYDGHDLTKMEGYDKTLSDKENWNKLNGTSLDSISEDLATDFPEQYDKVMGNIAQGGEQFVSSNGDGDTNIDAIGAFVNGYKQASQPDVVGLQQGLQLGQNAINNMANKRYGYDPNWKMKIGGRF